MCACACKQTFFARAIVSRHTCQCEKEIDQKTIASQNLRHAREREKSERNFSRNESEEEEEDKEERRLLFGKSFALSARAFYFFTRVIETI